MPSNVFSNVLRRFLRNTLQLRFCSWFAMENFLERMPYQFKIGKEFKEVIILSSSRRVMRKNFETELLVNNRKLPLNHFVQETLANIIAGFLKTLKETEESPTNIEIKIKKLVKPMDVDAHTYP